MALTSVKKDIGTKGLALLNKHNKKFPQNKISFSERKRFSSELDDYIVVRVLNLEAAKAKVKHHLDFFRSQAGDKTLTVEDFDRFFHSPQKYNFEKTLLDSPSSAGIFLGYGKKSAEMFSRRLELLSDQYSTKEIFPDIVNLFPKFHLRPTGVKGKSANKIDVEDGSLFTSSKPIRPSIMPLIIKVASSTKKAASSSAKNIKDSIHKQTGEKPIPSPKYLANQNISPKKGFKDPQSELDYIHNSSKKAEKWYQNQLNKSNISRYGDNLTPINFIMLHDDEEAKRTLRQTIKVYPKAVALIESDDFLYQTLMRITGRENARKLSETSIEI